MATTEAICPACGKSTYLEDGTLLQQGTKHWWKCDHCGKQWEVRMVFKELEKDTQEPKS